MAALNGATADVEGLAGWAMAPGAAMRAGEEGATVDWHRAFVESADFNSWQVEDLPAYAVAEGAGALDRVGGRLIPRRADGFVLRNDLVHCSLAHRYRDHAVWVTALSSLAGPWGPLLTEPSSYGGNATSAIPSHDLVLEVDGEVLPAPKWRVRRARRVRHAPIVNCLVQATPIELSTIDFAPRAPDLPLICRALRIENRAPGPHRVALRCYVGLPELVTRHCMLFNPEGVPGRHGLGYTRAEPEAEGLLLSAKGRALLLATDPAPAEVAIGAQGHWVWDEPAPPAATAAVADPADGFLRVDLGELGAGEVRQLCLFLVAGPKAASARETLAEARSCGPEALLRSTLDHWLAGCKGLRVSTSDRRVTDLIDALRDTVVQMSGRPRGHLRVGYYYNRAILKCGAHEQARDNLRQVISNWREGGITNEYHAFGAVSYWYDHAEIPQLLTLCARDYHDWTGDDAILPEARPMVEDCMAFLALTDRHLQILSGDETYRYCTVTDPWAENADNSFAAACCLEWAGRVWPELAQDYGALAGRIRASIEKHLVLPQGRYAHYVTANGWRDERPIADIMLRPLLLGYAPSGDPVVRRSVEAVWRHNRLPDGTITTDPAFYMSGQGACLMLQSLAELDSSAASEYFWSFVNSAPATGGWWEYTDNDDTTKSGGRLLGPEPLPSALEGLLHHLVGHKPVPGGLEVAPHLPQGLDWVRAEGFVVHGQSYDLRAERGGMTLVRQGDELLSTDRPVRARIVGDSLAVWPTLPTPPYAEGEPARLSWNDGWEVTPGPALGDFAMVYSPPGAALRYAQGCEGAHLKLTLTNLGERACACRVLGQTRRLAAQESWTLTLPAGSQPAIAWALLSPHHQRLEAVAPGSAFILQGRASRKSGAPWRGRLAIRNGEQETQVDLDPLGCFSAPLCAPTVPGTYAYRIHADGEGAPAADVAVRVAVDPLSALDDILGDVAPAAAIVCAGEPAARAAALWIWQEVLYLKQLSLPVYDRPLPAGEALNLILVGDEVGEEWPAPLTEGPGYAICPSPWNAGRYLIHVPSVESGDVREMAHGIVQALQLHTRRLARQYREPGLNEGIAIYEFNACHRDWQVASHFGQRPWQPIPVEIEAPGAEAHIGALAVSRGLLNPCEPPPAGRIDGAYARVYAFSTRPFSVTVAVECDAAQPTPVRVRLHAPLGVRLIWIPDISYYWVTGLPPTCHYDGAEEVARTWREADGTQTVEISLRPGEPIRPVLRYPPRNWTPRYPATYRRMEAVFTCLAPASLVGPC